MKKIVILALHLGVGGIEKYISSLCSVLDKKYEVEIISTFKACDVPAFPFSSNVKIKYLINGCEDDVSLKGLVKKFKVFSSIKEIVKRIKYKYLRVALNKKILENLDCDFVITTRVFHNELVSKYLKNDKIIKIATEHNYHQNDFNYVNPLVTSLRGFDYLVVATDELHSFYSKRLNKTKCIKIPNCLDFFSVEKTNFNNKNFISVGRFSTEKGFLDLIDVFSLIHEKSPKSKLYLLGDGYEKQLIEEKVKKLNLEDFIIMPGFVVGEEQKKYYFDSSVYIMTSYTECFGLVLIEAMNYGLPCIAFDCASGPRSVINCDVGVLVSNRDIKKMANCCSNLINDKKKLINYQKNINEYIKNFSKEEMGKYWDNLLNNKKR